MLMPRLFLLTAVALVAGALLAPAYATSGNGVAMQHQWGVMDKCLKSAIAKFPDHTAADLAKRDEFARQCQRNSRVPVRDGAAPK